MNANKKSDEKSIKDKKNQSTRVFARLISSRSELEKIAGGEKCEGTLVNGKARIDCTYEDY